MRDGRIFPLSLSSFPLMRGKVVELRREERGFKGRKSFGHKAHKLVSRKRI
jgi:hypothetical protein